MTQAIPLQALKKPTRKSIKKPPELVGYNFSPEQARQARDAGRLLSMRTELSLRCDLACRYCNGTSGTAPPGEIHSDVIKDTIRQVKDLGGESVVVIGGGEPTIYPKFRDIITFISSLGMIPALITNTQTITPDLAKFLYDSNASVLTKLDSLDEKRQDFLAGVNGAYKKIQEGLRHLVDVGFTDGGNDRLRLGASFVTTSMTLDETPDIWRYCRDRNIYPNQELLIPRGRALTELSELTPTVDQIHALKQKLLEVDQDEYGYDWNVHMPLTGQGCLQHMYSVYLTAMGYVRPCADVDIELFNVDDMTIAEVIDTPFFQIARHIEDGLEGKCGGCDHNYECIGCRGLAFSTGVLEGKSPYDAITREDPLCNKQPTD